MRSCALLAFAAPFAFLPSCRAAPAAEVAGLLAGSCSSAEQAKLDPEFFEVHLHMPRTWPDRIDGQWLSVEQAMATALDEPYRQRICCVTPAGDGAVLSSVFELPNAAARGTALRYERTALPGDPCGSVAAAAVSAPGATSFALMRRLRIRTAFAFDQHFAQAGFRLLG